MNNMDPKNFWKMLVPRLTVLVTTLDDNNKADVAPFSFISPISFDPPILMISIGINKHSYWNIVRRKEFVVNIPTKKLTEKILVAGEKYNPNVSKIERAGLKTKPAKKVGAPRLSECIGYLECYLEDAKKIGDHVAVYGKILVLDVDEKYLDDKMALNLKKVKVPLHIYENKFAFSSEIKEY